MNFAAARRLTLALAFFGAASPSRGEISVFAANEVRAAREKDRLRGIQTTLKDGSEGARRLSLSVTEAFRNTEDWAPAAEAFFARKNELAARAAALEVRFDAAIARNAPERKEAVTKALEPVSRTAAVLYSDYEFYMKLPQLAAGPQRQAAQAAMRLLGQTGDYPVSLAYFLDKTPRRPPFAPLPPGVMYIRHR